MILVFREKYRLAKDLQVLVLVIDKARRRQQEKEDERSTLCEHVS